MLNQKNGQGNAAKFWTLRALAERKLENLSGLYALAPNAAETMIHEVSPHHFCVCLLYILMLV